MVVYWRRGGPETRTRTDGGATSTTRYDARISDDNVSRKVVWWIVGSGIRDAGISMDEGSES